ncbi:MAG: Crp/Fnr family transcriptional regulator [Christensenellales bacterium]
MEPLIPILQTNRLFHGMSGPEINSILGCLNAHTKRYQKNEIIYDTGDTVSDMGILLSGQALIYREDYLGNRTIMAHLSKGSLFAESFVYADARILPVTVESTTESEILFMDYKRIVNRCSNACVFHTRLIENMLSVLANKNVILNQKIEHLSRRTTREKLLSYLSEQSLTRNAREFDIPLNRQQLADYLCVDRSALSSELGKMQKEEILAFYKNHFHLHQ